MKKYLIALALVLASCSQSAGKDGYTFNKEQFTHKNFEIEIVTYKNLSELRHTARTKYNVTNEKLAAFSIVYPISNKCVVHIIDPKIKYEPEFIGHELTHCIYGQWHSGNDLSS